MTEGSPNFVSWLSLIVFGPIALWMFSRMKPHIAAVWTMLCAVLFLPEVINFDAPLIPPIDKFAVGTIWATVGCMWKAPHKLRRANMLRGVDRFFLLVLLGNVGTALTNGDELITGGVTRPALGLWDAFSGLIQDSLGFFLPFFIGRAMIRTPDELRDFLRILVHAALIYTLFALFEIRMSPQSHRLLYGYHPASFEMTIRGGGYRPTIFMISGLGVAMFFLSGLIAAIVRVKAGEKKYGRAYVPVYLGVVLVLCKSTGALIYGAAIAPIVALTKKPKFLLPLILGALVFGFPILRGADLFPTEGLLQAFLEAGVSPERTNSLRFRFDNEDALLARARERVLFGWGENNRQHILDPKTGDDLSITDGAWIIEFGQRGFVGYVGTFGLLLWPLLQAYRSRRRVQGPDRLLVAGLALILAINAVDLLPNGLFSYLPYLYSGVLAGVLPFYIAQARQNRGPAARKRMRTDRESVESIPTSAAA